MRLSRFVTQFTLAESHSEGEEIIQTERDLSEVARYRSFVGLMTDRRPDVYARDDVDRGVTP
ncbi:hypothetical protein FXN63_12940 [Pigmentiphaga aceris]|uniref:Uncharacterized protein n=1 Tax=Pigmentiphaga aceris TaxID=1940612 RepID=A0A5C0AWE9_9BURK|nr:hypothetical protein [Pigmentiphaga aceris]QEI06638.1 hypothetical protein FXN63_12940 [Pigmentiphaga aceris]